MEDELKTEEKSIADDLSALNKKSKFLDKQYQEANSQLRDIVRFQLNLALFDNADTELPERSVPQHSAVEMIGDYTLASYQLVLLALFSSPLPLCLIALCLPIQLPTPCRPWIVYLPVYLHHRTLIL